MQIVKIVTCWICDECLAASRVATHDRGHLEGISLDRVKGFYKRYGRDNALVKFCISAGFLAPLLNVLGDAEQPWYVLVGPAGCGKSSLLANAGAAFGGDLQGPLGYVCSLSGTAIGIEDLSMSHRDLPFLIDDLQALAVDPRKRAQTLHDLVFRISGGRQRARHQQPPDGWRNITIAGSNDSVERIMRAGGVEYSDALRGRAIDLPCNYKYGIFESVPAGVLPSKFVQEMKEEAIAIRGWAGEYFARKLVRYDRTELLAKLGAWRNQARETLGLGDRSRGVEAFAAVYMAGCFAAEFDLLPWSSDRLLSAVTRIHDDHCRFSNREGVKRSPVRTLTKYIERYGKEFLVAEPATKINESKVLKARGIKSVTKKGSIEYCFFDAKFIKIFGDSRQTAMAIRELKALKVLKYAGSKNVLKRVFGPTRYWYHCVDGKVLSKLSKGKH